MRRPLPWTQTFLMVYLRFCPTLSSINHDQASCLCWRLLFFPFQTDHTLVCREETWWSSDIGHIAQMNDVFFQSSHTMIILSTLGRTLSCTSAHRTWPTRTLKSTWKRSSKHAPLTWLEQCLNGFNCREAVPFKDNWTHSHYLGIHPLILPKVPVFFVAAIIFLRCLNSVERRVPPPSFRRERIVVCFTSHGSLNELELPCSTAATMTLTPPCLTVGV